MPAPNLLDELEGVVRLNEKATPGEWRTEYRKTARGYAQEVFDAAGDTIATLAWHAVPLNDTTTATDREPNAHLIAAAVNFIRTHHATLADMAKRLEAAERDAARYRWLLNQSVRIEARAWVWEPNEPEIMHPDERFDAATQEGEG